jgi:hypothetical protein
MEQRPVDVVALDRIEPGQDPPYCTFGRATCVGGCGEWVWLGSETVGVVSRGEAMPLCLQCVDRIALGMMAAGLGLPARIGRLRDQRHEGAH